MGTVCWPLQERLLPPDTSTTVMKLSFLILAVILALTASAPQGRSQNTDTRFFTGNQAIDSAAVGAGLGLATQYIANQIFNPCRNRNRNRNKTNNRIFGNNGFSNGLLGFLGGYIGGQLINNAQGNPCGR